MSPTASRLAIFLGAILVLAGVNWSIYKKEVIKSSGELVYLELAPVDPRSLMQGDYLALQFAVANAIAARFSQVTPADDKLIYGVQLAELTIDWQRVGRIIDGKAASTPATPVITGPPIGKINIAWRMRQGRVWLGTNAFFFEEGSAQKYSSARYGEFRIDRATGEAVLVGLRDQTLKVL
ncbi:MAG: GDYXXLXY domain-containing protein [Rhodocyclaceae bacterium]|jgi:uncharacterized membrane-anchored protein|nr:GDYXXLXY domain-containing protein [Rhodocyclaceae bacterium]MCA3082023.1 GDYXXLXY domain-containing protein [Rhodocyclaceae bacterium]